LAAGANSDHSCFLSIQKILTSAALELVLEARPPAMHLSSISFSLALNSTFRDMSFSFLEIGKIGGGGAGQQKGGKGEYNSNELTVHKSKHKI